MFVPHLIKMSSVSELSGMIFKQAVTQGAYREQVLLQNWGPRISTALELD
jgi:hypothetical protein